MGYQTTPLLIILSDLELEGHFKFLRASAMLKHVIAIGLTSVCPSVRPSVRHTLVLYQNG